MRPVGKQLCAELVSVVAIALGCADASISQRQSGGQDSDQLAGNPNTRPSEESEELTGGDIENLGYAPIVVSATNLAQTDVKCSAVPNKENTHYLTDCKGVVAQNGKLHPVILGTGVSAAWADLMLKVIADGKMTSVKLDSQTANCRIDAKATEMRCSVAMGGSVTKDGVVFKTAWTVTAGEKKKETPKQFAYNRFIFDETPQPGFTAAGWDWHSPVSSVTDHAGNVAVVYIRRNIGSVTAAGYFLNPEDVITEVVFRLFDNASGKWSEHIVDRLVKSDGTNAPIHSIVKVALGNQGNALVAWTSHPDFSAASAGNRGDGLYSRFFDRSKNTWEAVQTLTNATLRLTALDNSGHGAPRQEAFWLAMNSSDKAVMAVAVEGSDGAGLRLYASRFENRVWGTPSALKTSGTTSKASTQSVINGNPDTIDAGAITINEQSHAAFIMTQHLNSVSFSWASNGSKDWSFKEFTDDIPHANNQSQISNHLTVDHSDESILLYTLAGTEDRKTKLYTYEYKPNSGNWSIILDGATLVDQNENVLTWTGRLAYTPMAFDRLGRATFIVFSVDDIHAFNATPKSGQISSILIGVTTSTSLRWPVISLNQSGDMILSYYAQDRADHLKYHWRNQSRVGFDGTVTEPLDMASISFSKDSEALDTMLGSSVAVSSADKAFLCMRPFEYVRKPAPFGQTQNLRIYPELKLFTGER